MNQQKNYIGFLNDNSGSMNYLSAAALKDYNGNVEAVKSAATNNMQDTIVSSFGFGSGTVTRNVVNSNPHVLQPLTTWRAAGGTPGRKAIKEMIDMFKSLPDYSNPNVAFVVFCTTDGEFDGDSWGNSGPTTRELAADIATLLRTERWTFVFRVPTGGKRFLDGLGIPAGNIQEWNTTEAGMAASSVQTTQAFDAFYATRATGKTSSTVFYANATAVDTSKLLDVSKRTSLYVVESHEAGDQIRDFILRRRTRYLKGAAFYQLTKTESRVGPNKMLAVRDRATGVVYAGKEARTMLGLSSVDNIRLHPGDHGKFDLFIQSESVNRKLVVGSGVLYWEEIGVPFTQEEIDRFTGVTAPKPAAPAVVQLVAVPVSNKPTKSPIPVTPKPAAVAPCRPMPIKHIGFDGRYRYYLPGSDARFCNTRDEARAIAESIGKKQYDAGPYAAKGKRFYVA